MLASQLPPSQMESAFQGTSNALKNDINEVMRTGNYYVTPEMGHQMASLDSAVNHLRLDSQLMGSNDWGTKFDPNLTATNKAAAIGKMGKAVGTMRNYKQQFNNTNMGTLQENQIREFHEKSARDFDGVKKELFPQANGAYNRIKQFCDHIGVTDRYTGYRHNLTRGSRDPVRLGFAWLDTMKNPQNATLNTGWNSRAKTVSFGPRPGKHTALEPYDGPSSWRQSSIPGVQRSHTEPAMAVSQRSSTTLDPKTNPTHRSMTAMPRSMQGDESTWRLGPATWSTQEQSGINTTFPGRTEYMKRYVKPPTDLPTQDFIVNPVGNFKMHGRPLMKTQWSADTTEYQTRYEWPDGRKIVKLPWLRK